MKVSGRGIRVGVGEIFLLESVEETVAIGVGTSANDPAAGVGTNKLSGGGAGNAVRTFTVTLWIKSGIKTTALAKAMINTMMEKKIIFLNIGIGYRV